MEKKLLIGVTVISFLFIFISYFLITNFSSKTNLKKVEIISYQASEEKRPKAKVDLDFKDIGTIKISEEKTADFVVKNIGYKPLQLFNISSSCGCTFGKIIFDNQESEEFGMHSQSDYVGEVLPGKQAIVKVIYRPYIMPVYGLVEREVYVATNDPDHPRLVFKVKAMVK